ncbi:MAG: NAD(P)-dependent alcohol dehydrogenase [Acidimicrobiales bacterium]
MPASPTAHASPTVPTNPATVRAVLQDRYGDAGVLAVGEVATPELRAGEVLVRVEAAGIDRGTVHLLRGLPLLARLEAGVRRPKRRVPGFDVSGIVVEVGDGVDGFSVGDAVCGIGRGSLAELAPALARKLAHRPEEVDAVDAGVLAISGLTALQALRDAAKVEAGDEVLVLGASGGVGSYAVQLAKAMGARVTGVCSGSKADLVRSLGADVVVDHATVDPLGGTATYDVILDIGGGRPLRRLKRALRPAGTVVLVGNETGGKVAGGFLGRFLGGLLLSIGGSRRLVGFIAKEAGADVEVLLEYVTSGAVRPHVDRVVGLDGVADALRDLEAGRVRGKVAVRP